MNTDPFSNKHSDNKKSYRPLNNRFYLFKINFLAVLILIVFVVIVFRLFYLQIFRSDYLSEQAVSNKRQVVRIPSYRGEIFLKNNQKLAENLTSFSIYLVPNNFPKKSHSLEKFNKLIDRIEKNFGISEKKIISILKKSRRNPYRLYLLKDKVAKEKIYFLAENLEEYPGLVYQDTLVRFYPLGDIYSHISGYVQGVNVKELREKEKLGYGPNSVIGKTGVESYYDLELRGKDGYKVHIVDVKNRIKEEIFPKEGKPVPGKNLYLTIDPSIQKILHQTLQGFPGGAIVTKVNTGEILGMYSYPFYDPNLFSEKNNLAKFNAYLEDERKPFLNRVIQAQYPPSSIFKLIVSFAALDDPKITVNNTSYFCEEKLVIGDSVFKCTAYHGWQNFTEAIANSCNVFFYKLGIQITPQVIGEYAKTFFNFGNLTGIDLVYEKRGRIPTPRWKIEHRGTFWWDGDTANFSIGQGFTLTTLVQVNSMTAAIANNGRAYRPHLLSHMESLEDQTVSYTDPSVLLQFPFSKKNIKFVQRAMRNVVKWGTAHRINNDKLLIAGKTGTAQSIPGQENHAWFTGYAPYTSWDDPKIRERQIAVTVFVEHGGFGSIYPATFADAILQAIFLKRNPVTVIKERLQLWESQSERYEKWLEVRQEKKLPSSYFDRYEKSI